MEQKHPDSPVQMKYVNHGNVFGTGNWYTFYCGNCGNQVYGDVEECEKCGAIRQRVHPIPYNKQEREG